MAEPELYYFHKPTGLRPVSRPVKFLTVPEFLADEPACRTLWDLVSTQFNTRGKFLAIWPGVRFVALSRDEAGNADGFLLVNAPVNWQIDYVVVRPDRRGHGLAAALVSETLNQAHLRGAPYVMLTSKASLRPLYESCGFTVVGTTNTRTPPPAPPRNGEGSGPLGTLLPLPSQGRGMGG